MLRSFPAPGRQEAPRLGIARAWTCPAEFIIIHSSRGTSPRRQGAVLTRTERELLERDSELAQLAAALDQAGAARGRLIVL